MFELFHLIACSLITLSALADEPRLPSPSDQDSRIEHAEAPSSSQGHPLQLFMLSPTAVTRSEPQRSIQGNFSMSNTWGPPVALISCTGTPCAERDPIQMNAAPVAVRFYSSDGVVRDYQIRYTEPFGPKTELQVSFNFYQLNGCGTIDKPVCDGFIEWFHRSLTAHPDPFGRGQRPFDQAQISIYDNQNRFFEVKDGQLFLGTLDLSVIRYIKLIDKAGKTLTSMNVGVHSAVPLNSTHPYVPAAISAELTNTTAFRKNGSWSFTTSVGGSLTAHSLIPLKESNINLVDDDKKITPAYHFMLAFNKDYKTKRLSAGMELTGRSSFLDKNNYDYWMPINNFGTKASPDPSTVGKNRTVNSLLNPVEYATFFLTIKSKKSQRSFTVYAREDLSIFGPSPRLFNGGNNGSDFTVGGSFKWGFNIKKK
ncbi:MAG: hypothetical protein IT289_07700 [Oligoflexia bacterium]|nr:hypothetical protein [Oligoflexia bacterium]